MSSDVACMPPWKMALMERKRRQDKDAGSQGSGVKQEQLDINGLPLWKRDIIVKKQQQKNTFVFMAKSPSSTIVGNDKAERFSEQTDAVSNGHTDSAEIDKQHSFITSSKSTSSTSEYVNTKNNIQNSNGITDHEETVDRPAEERLLPIHRNPILRLDIEKRHSSSSQTARNSLSPRGGSDYVSSHDQMPVIDDTNVVLSARAFSRSESECDVFTAEETSLDSEVTYGRGFVHKLLLKFSHLAATDQSIAGHVQPLKQSSSSTSQSRSSSSSPGCTLGKVPFADPESSPKQHNLIMSRVKCHSVDDLLRDPDRRLSLTDFPAYIDTRKSNEGTSLNFNGEFDANGRPPLQVRSSVEDTEELPISNIVSSTRSLFENLVTSPRLSNAALPHSNSFSRFSYGDSLDKTKSKSGELTLSSSAAQNRDPISMPSANGGQETKVNNLTVVKQNTVEPAKFVIMFKDNSNGNGDHLDVVDSIPSQSVHNSVEDVNNTRTGEDVHAHSAKFSSVHSYRINGQSHKQETDIAQDVLSKLLPHPHSSSAPIPSDKVDVAKSSQVVLNGKSSHSVGNNHDGLEFLPTKNEIVTSVVSPSPAPVKQNEMRKSFPESTTGQKNGSARHWNNGENISWGSGSTTNSSQKTGPSRPGKLLIRPASNLVAAKTKTEYLALTKYNDVRKGEFAPAAKKSVEQAIDDDESVVDGDMVYIAADVEVKENSIVFAGAGVSLNRSLLNKSRHGKRLHLTFDDSMSRTFEYPSEQSLMDASPAQPGDCDYEPSSAVGSSSTSGNLRTSPISGTSAAALSSYRSRMQVDYQFGMHFREEPKVEPPPTTQATDAVKSPDQDSSMWSKGASADLLF